MAVVLGAVIAGVLGFLIGFVRTSVVSGESVSYSVQIGLIGMAVAVTAVLLAAAVTRVLGERDGGGH